MPPVPTYTEEAQAEFFGLTEAEIMERVEDGQSVASIAQSIGKNRSTLVRWLASDEQRSTRLTRAREIGCHAMAEQCMEIADTPAEGVETTTKADGGVEEKRGDMLQHRRLQIETRMRLMGKWLPMVYGDKTQHEHSGTIGIAEALSAAKSRMDAPKVAPDATE